MPNIVGLSLSDACSLLMSLGLLYEIDGKMVLLQDNIHLQERCFIINRQLLSKLKLKIPIEVIVQARFLLIAFCILTKNLTILCICHYFQPFLKVGLDI
jgi:hypothetical protein